MRSRVGLAVAAALLASGCASSQSRSHQGASGPSASPPASTVATQQALRFGQTGQASNASGDAWRITVSAPVLVAPWHKNPDQGSRIVVYRVVAANVHGAGDVAATDFEERVTGFARNDLWSAGTSDAGLGRFMAAHKFLPQPPAAGTQVRASDPATPRAYYVAIPFSGRLSQVELRPFGADDNSPAAVIWR